MTTTTVEKGNEQLKEARRRAKDSRAFHTDIPYWSQFQFAVLTLLLKFYCTLYIYGRSILYHYHTPHAMATTSF